MALTEVRLLLEAFGPPEDLIYRTHPTLGSPFTSTWEPFAQLVRAVCGHLSVPSTEIWRWRCVGNGVVRT